MTPAKTSPKPKTRRKAKPRTARVHFLDVGQQEYGDAVLCEFGETTVLIDGAHPGDHAGSSGHPSIPQQLRALLPDAGSPLKVDLLVVTHAHQDHIGCLPHLVAHGLLTADWALVADPQLGWGRAADDDIGTPPVDARVQRVVAGLREELLSPATDDQTLARFLADAANLETRYTDMLATLENAGTKVVRVGRDEDAPLLQAFRGIGLEILGPSQEQLLVCADAIARKGSDSVSLVGNAVAGSDAAASEADLYRAAITGPVGDALDAQARPGPAINLQSVVTRFKYGESKLLFAGDMQFADPQLSSPVLNEELAALRKRISDKAPYSLVKISHHGSDNAFDAGLLQELGTTPLYGICAGEDSSVHPNARVLRLLDSASDHLNWVRTDRNGQATIELDGKTKITLAHGEVNDPRPNALDTATRAHPAGHAVAHKERGRETGAVSQHVTHGVSEQEGVEVTTRIPAGVGRVTVTVDIEGFRPEKQPVSGVADDLAALVVGGGRKLPRLLFVTSAEALASNLGEVEARLVLDAIRASHALYDELPSGQTEPSHALELVRAQLQEHPDFVGVVLVGGYSVVPAQRLDALPADLRQELGQTDDADDFIVWSDDGYGDRDGDQIAELPVSRIPDGNSADLLMAGLTASDEARVAPRTGVRNVARPFAEGVFAPLPGSDGLYVSEPTTDADAPSLDGDLVYLMLHGDFVDCSRFWGEDTAAGREAVNLTNIGSKGGRVVLTGCCWGALIAEHPAARAIPNAVPPSKVVGASMALAFIERGATAFVGCTGSHYSPTEAPYAYFGGPMHISFWSALLGGSAPSRALFEAKLDYVRDFPHGQPSALFQAIEYKVLRQFTCLGLGW